MAHRSSQTDCQLDGVRCRLHGGERKRRLGPGEDEDISRMQEDEDTKDIVLVCDKKRVRVHSFILLARSPVFRTMLTSDMEERRSGEVVIHGVEYDVVKEMVTFLYSVNITPGFTKLEELLVLANM